MRHCAKRAFIYIFASRQSLLVICSTGKSWFAVFFLKSRRFPFFVGNPGQCRFVSESASVAQCLFPVAHLHTGAAFKNKYRWCHTHTHAEGKKREMWVRVCSIQQWISPTGSYSQAKKGFKIADVSGQGVPKQDRQTCAVFVVCAALSVVGETLTKPIISALCT